MFAIECVRPFDSLTTFLSLWSFRRRKLLPPVVKFPHAEKYSACGTVYSAGGIGSRWLSVAECPLAEKSIPHAECCVPRAEQGHSGCGSGSGARRSPPPAPPLGPLKSFLHNLCNMECYPAKATAMICCPQIERSMFVTVLGNCPWEPCDSPWEPCRPSST